MPIDKSQLSVGDSVDILVQKSNIVAHSGAIVESIDNTNKEIVLSNLSTFSPYQNAAGQTISQTYSIRRNLFKAKSSPTLLKLGNDVYISNAIMFILLTINFGYVASNFTSYLINDALLNQHQMVENHI